MLCAIWVYNLTGAKFLLELCKKISAQTLDLQFRSRADGAPYTVGRDEAGRAKEAELSGADRPYTRTQYHYSHVVNVGMGLEAPAMNYLVSGSRKDREAFYEAWQKLRRHGVAMGMFTGDEHPQ